MKVIKYSLIVALLAGCSTTFRPWNLSEIKEGMDRAQVTEVLGEPDSIEMKNNAEFLYYSYREDNNVSPADSDFQAYDANRELRELQIQSRFKEYKYVVKMVDGKVQTYKELQN